MFTSQYVFGLALGPCHDISKPNPIYIIYYIYIDFLFLFPVWKKQRMLVCSNMCKEEILLLNSIGRLES